MMFTVSKRFLDPEFSVDIPLVGDEREEYFNREAELQDLYQAEYEQRRTPLPSGNRIAHLLEPAVQSPARRKRFSILSDTELNSLPDPEWQIEELWQAQTLVLLYGESGVGKSFVAIDLAACIAAGISWNGREMAHSGPVIYISAEGGASLKLRVGAWKLDHGFGPSDKINLHFIREAVNLAEPRIGDVDALVESIKEALPHDSPVLIVVDTLARAFGAANENETAHMNTFIAQCDRLRLEFEATVLIVHHTGKSAYGERGSSALKAAVDTALSLEGSKGTLTLTRKKQKDGEEGPFAEIALAPLAGSRVVKEIGGSTTSRLGKPLSAEQRACLIALHSLGLAGATSTQWMQASGAKPQTFARWRREVFMPGGFVENPDPGTSGSLYRLTPEGLAALEIPVDDYHSRSGSINAGIFTVPRLLPSLSKS
jgi:KaiC/GvpD/RAD55 family RecA-like ATPase